MVPWEDRARRPYTSGLTPAIITALIIVAIAGALLRLIPVAGNGFPLNDGGLFLTMAGDLAENGWVPPATTSYNDLNIPFAYPPGGFYVVALLGAIGLTGLDILRWLPALFSIATIPVVYLIGREVFRSPIMGVAAAAFFAVSTGSYEWVVVGGGITRAPGFLIALVAVLLQLNAYRRPGWGWVIVAGVATGATAWFHPQAAVFAAISAIVLLPFAPSPSLGARIRRLTGIGLVAVLVVTPWVALVVARHGVDPFVSALSSGGTPLIGLVNVIASRTTPGELGVLSIATTFGLVISAVRRFWLPVVWVLAIAIVDSRAGQPFISVPVALAIAFAVRDVGGVLDRHLSSRPLAPAGVLAAVLVAAAFVDSLLVQDAVGSPLQAVSAQEQQAMQWIAESTESDAAFAVVAGRYWARDAVAEWFPVLAERHSVTTVQGHEWLGPTTFEEQERRAAELPQCVAIDDAECIERWFDDAPSVDYLFLTRSAEAAEAGLECCLQLADQVGWFRKGEVVHQSGDGDVLVVRLAAP